MCFPLMRSLLFREGEETIAVVLVLLAASLDLGGEAGGQVFGKGVKLVENFCDAILFFEGWEVYFYE